MALPRPINWLQKPAPPYTNTTVYEEKIRRLELDNFELRQRIATAKEGVEDLQSSLEPAIEEITESYQNQIQAYRELLAGMAQTFEALVAVNTGLPPEMLAILVDRLQQFRD